MGIQRSQTVSSSRIILHTYVLDDQSRPLRRRPHARVASCHSVLERKLPKASRADGQAGCSLRSGLKLRHSRNNIERFL